MTLLVAGSVLSNRSSLLGKDRAHSGYGSPDCARSRSSITDRNFPLYSLGPSLPKIVVIFTGCEMFRFGSRSRWVSSSTAAVHLREEQTMLAAGLLYFFGSLGS